MTSEELDWLRKRFVESARWADATLCNSTLITWGFDPLPEEEAAALMRASRAAKVRRIRNNDDK